MVFEEVQADLESEGYEVQSFILPAASVNAPHRRDRIWFIAYNASYSSSIGFCKHSSRKELFSETFGTQLWMDKQNATYSERIRLEHGTKSRQIRGEEENSSGKRNKSSLSTKAISNERKPNWEYFPTQSPICDGNDGISDRLDGITFSKWRKESIKGGGNAIVPQVALQIFKAIQHYEDQYANKL
jgi:DNA (cytosine-5)-methyltransferase 1